MAFATWTLLAVATAQQAYAQAYVPTPADIENVRIQHYLGWAWLALFCAVFLYRWIIFGLRHMRMLANLNQNSDGRQRFFATPNEKWAKVKRYILEAPLFRKRHNREFKLSAATNVGTLPSRFQTLFIAGYLGMNIAFCVISIDWSSPEMLDDLLNRTGTLAVMNMLPLFLLAGRNNPLIYLLGISFDTYNMIHRWIGRIVVLEALVHALAWVVKTVQKEGWAVVAKEMSPAGDNSMIISGTVVS